MGRKITQIIYVCSICNKEGKDGDIFYTMGVEIWCDDCCEKEEEKE